MATEKDRFGEKIRDAEKGQEEQYFARQNRELLEKVRRARAQEFSDELKAASTMKCPRCGTALRERVEHDIRAEECPKCGGLWLDKGEFEVLAGREVQGWFGRLFRARQSDPR